mmetsp:Transcript_17620/g.24850  ORF Transcript_17620/g.24850 Transcript_17620/m.24850 type:complete len:390 (+) Transcript_17620:1-1170(+)
MKTRIFGYVHAMSHQQLPLTRMIFFVILQISILFYFALPVLLATSPQHLFLLFLFFFSIFVVIRDCTNLLKTHIFHTKRHVQSLANSIVLDEILKTIFSMKDGWVSQTFMSTIGCAILYNLPINYDQRNRIIQTFLPRNIDATELLMSPGGYISLYKNYYNISEYNEKHSNDVVDAKKDSFSSNEMPRVRIADNSDNSVLEINESDKNPEEQRSNAAIQMSQKHGSNPMKKTSSPENSTDIFWSILVQIINEILQKVLILLDEKKIKTVGYLSALALLMQLKHSSRTRNMMISILRGSLAIGLAGSTLSAITLCLLKRRHIWDADGNVSQACNFSSRKFTAFNKLVVLTTFLIRFRRYFTGIKKNHGLQGIVAIFVLYYFSRKKKIMQR